MNSIRTALVAALATALLTTAASTAQVHTSNRTSKASCWTKGDIVFTGNRPELDVEHAVRPRIGLKGTSGLLLPTLLRPTRVLRFGYEARGWSSSLRVSDDRDPQHGFRWMMAIDGTGKLTLSGCKKTLQLVPRRRYVFELRWAWDEGGLRLDSLKVTDGSSSLLLRSGERRVGKPGLALRFQHSGAGSCWLDTLSIAQS